jgi:hypothetical protein
MEDESTPPPLVHDVNFVTTPGGYEIWFSERIAGDHPSLVDQCADWLEDELGAVNLGQIDHSALLADGVLSDRLRADVVGWWSARVPGLEHASSRRRPAVVRGAADPIASRTVES